MVAGQHQPQEGTWASWKGWTRQVLWGNGDFPGHLGARGRPGGLEEASTLGGGDFPGHLEADVAKELHKIRGWNSIGFQTE